MAVSISSSLEIEVEEQLPKFSLSGTKEASHFPCTVVRKESSGKNKFCILRLKITHTSPC
jgi:hypothetical protein